MVGDANGARLENANATVGKHEADFVFKRLLIAKQGLYFLPDAHAIVGVKQGTRERQESAVRPAKCSACGTFEPTRRTADWRRHIPSFRDSRALRLVRGAIRFSSAARLMSRVSVTSWTTETNWAVFPLRPREGVRA